MLSSNLVSHNLSVERCCQRLPWTEQQDSADQYRNQWRMEVVILVVWVCYVKSSNHLSVMRKRCDDGQTIVCSCHLKPGGSCCGVKFCGLIKFGGEIFLVFNCEFNFGVKLSHHVHFVLEFFGQGFYLRCFCLRVNVSQTKVSFFSLILWIDLFGHHGP